MSTCLKDRSRMLKSAAILLASGVLLAPLAARSEPEKTPAKPLIVQPDPVAAHVPLGAARIIGAPPKTSVYGTPQKPREAYQYSMPNRWSGDEKNSYSMPNGGRNVNPKNLDSMNVAPAPLDLGATTGGGFGGGNFGGGGFSR